MFCCMYQKRRRHKLTILIKRHNASLGGAYVDDSVDRVPGMLVTVPLLLQY